MDETQRWAFRSFVSEGRESAVHSWYQGQTKKVRAVFDTRLKYLRDWPKWDMPRTRVLEGECDGLIEIRFFAENVQHRPLGFYGPLKLEFTIAFFATERGGKFYPRNSCGTALGRKSIVYGNREKCSCEWKVE
jgi:hypothetical protein